MSARRLQDGIANLKRATANLEKALSLPTDQELVFEGTIHRFEIVVELTWKTLKRALEFEGRAPRTPRESLKEAFGLGWLGEDEGVWLDLLDYRNMTSHVYLDDDLVAETYAKIKHIAPVIDTLLTVLETRYIEIT